MKVVSSGVKTADSAVISKSCIFNQVVVQPDGVNDVTVAIYDGTDATGTQVLPTFTFAGDGGPQATPPIKLNMAAGIYVDITTAGAVAYSIIYAR